MAMPEVTSYRPNWALASAKEPAGGSLAREWHGQADGMAGILRAASGLMAVRRTRAQGKSSAGTRPVAGRRADSAASGGARPIRALEYDRPRSARSR